MTIPRVLLTLAWIGLLCAVALMSGCASFENRLTTTLTCDRVFVTSLYTRLGITSELSEADAAVIRSVRCSEQK